MKNKLNMFFDPEIIRGPSRHLTSIGFDRTIVFFMICLILFLDFVIDFLGLKTQKMEMMPYLIPFWGLFSLIFPLNPASKADLFLSGVDG